MSRIRALLALLAGPMLTAAQPIDSARAQPAWRASGFERVVHAEAAFDHGANSLWNELPLGLWQGGYLDRALRERSRDALRSRNTVGYSIAARLSYIGPRQGRMRPVISVAHREQLGARFTADLFSLAFFGNAAYEARRADLGPTRFTHVRYQTIGFGLTDARGDRMARFDFVIGQSLNAARIRWADLYTGTDGRVLRANIRGDYQRSDTAASGAGTMNGFGLAFSGSWRLPLRRDAHGLRIVLEAEDLGFCAWGRESLRLRRDTTLRFAGITVDNILELDAAIVGEDALLDTLGLRYQRGAFTTLLPFTLRGTASLPFEERWELQASVEQRNMPGFAPQVAMGAVRSLGARSRVDARLTMGGYGGLRLGAGLETVVGKRWLLRAGTPHLPAFITGRTRGAGLWIGASLGI